MLKIIVLAFFTLTSIALYTETISLESESFIVDVKNQITSDNKTSVDLDVYTRGMANGVIEVYDEDNNLIEYKVIQGHRSETAVISNVAGSMKRTYQDLFTESTGTRSPHVRQKTNVTMDLPLGGYFLVTKEGERALAINLAVMMTEIVSEIISENLTGNIEYVQSLADEIIVNMPSMLIEEEFFGNGVDSNDFLDEAFDLALSVTQEVGLKVASNKIKESILAAGTGGISELYGKAETFKKYTQLVGIIKDLNLNRSSDRSLSYDGYNSNSIIHKVAIELSEEIKLTDGKNETGAGTLAPSSSKLIEDDYEDSWNFTLSSIDNYNNELKTGIIENYKTTSVKSDQSHSYDEGRIENESGGDAIDIETSGNLSLTYSESNIATLNISLVKGNQQNGFMQTSAQASMGPDHSPREIENVYEPDVAYGAEEYSYTEWGRWSGNDPDYPFYENKSGYVVLGVPTPDDYLPDATGTATYTGDVMGAYSGGSYGDGYLGGRTRLTADFDTNTIEGALFLNRIYSAGETEQMRTVTFEYEIDQQGGYGGMLTVDENPGAGQLYGEFYGPKAEETGGAFVFSHQDAGNRNELVEGVYRATKTAGSDLSR